MKRPKAILKTDEIKKSVDQYKVDNWIDTTFTNVDEAPVKIQGIVYQKGETFNAGVAHYEVETLISVQFQPETPGQTQCVVVNYGVLKCN